MEDTQEVVSAGQLQMPLQAARASTKEVDSVEAVSGAPRPMVEFHLNYINRIQLTTFSISWCIIAIFQPRRRLRQIKYPSR